MARTVLPAWMVDHLTTVNGISPGAGSLERRQCTRCRALVLVGYDGPWAAMIVVVDPTPVVTQIEEDRARAEGRRTYNLRHRGRTLFLSPRDHWQRARTPAGSQPMRGPLGYLIVPEHRCWERET